MLLPLTAALTPNQYPSQDGSGNGTVPTDATAILTRADVTPNASQPVRFGTFYSLQQSVFQPLSSWPDWSWTVKVSDVSLPNSSTTVPSAHVAYTTYEFAYPGGNDLAAALQAQSNYSSTAATAASCVYIFDIDFPAQVSSSWDSNPGSGPSRGSCAPIISDTCAGQIALNMAFSGCNERDARVTWLGRGTLETCRDSLIANTNDGRGIGVLAVYNLTDPSTTSNNSIRSGGNFFWSLSKPYPADNTTVYDDAVYSLRMMGLVTPGGAQLMCNRVERGPTEGAALLSHGARNTGVVLMVAFAVAVFCA